MGSIAQFPARVPDGDFAELVQRVKDSHNLSDIIARHTDLKKRGGREMVGLCPFHKERTPSFEVNDDKGLYHCHGCGKSGDALTFLQDAERMTFRQAYETLAGDDFPVISDEQRAQRKVEDERKQAARMQRAKDIWACGVDPVGTPAEVYTRSRGITIALPPSIMFASIPRWWDDETGECGRNHPAMVCALQDNSDEVVGVQCIYLQDGGRSKYTRQNSNGRAAAAKLTFGRLMGSALRLGPIAESIIFCEGPEDGLTLAQKLPGQSVWVSCGTAAMAKMKFPQKVRSLILAGDNNDSGKLAVAQARHANQERGLAVQEVYPDAAFRDWNDQLRGIRS